MTVTDDSHDEQPKLICERIVKLRRKRDSVESNFHISIFRLARRTEDPNWMVCYAVENGFTQTKTTHLGIDDMHALSECIMAVDSMLILMRRDYDISIGGLPLKGSRWSSFLSDTAEKKKAHLQTLRPAEDI